MNRPLTVVALFVLSLALGCPRKPPTAAPTAGMGGTWKASASGDGFRLSEADEPGAPEAIPLAKASVLSAAETNKVLARLPALKPEPEDQKSFALRGGSVPAPRAGKTVSEPFPPPESGPPPAAPPSGPLTVVRRAPEGPVDLAPFLSVTFSLPMVAVTSHADLAKAAPPVKLSPLPAGEWRWIGTQTVVFQPAKRFPMATDYQVEIPAGTKSAGGQALASAQTWAFSTPAPKLVQHLPAGVAPVALEPIFFAAFDQEIDKRAVLQSITLTAEAGRSLPIRLATDAEIASDKGVSAAAAKVDAKRWLAFRAEDALPPATDLVVHVGPGTPSAEGPKKTSTEQKFGVRTHGPMKLVEARCGWEKHCPPLTPWTLTMSNPVDPKTFQKGMVRVRPEIPAMKVSTSGQTINIVGRTKGRTKYKVTLAEAIRDTFGQAMGRDADAEIEVGPADPALMRETHEMVVLDPAGGPVLPVRSVNERDLRVRLYAVRPEDWKGYVEFRQAWDREAKETTPPGRLVQSALITTGGTTKGEPDELTETPIDLRPALGAEGFGQVVAIVEPTHPTGQHGSWSRQWVRAWVQVTKLGLDAFVDREELVGWTSNLATGAPVEGAEVALLHAGSGKTGADGLGRIALTTAPGDLLLARKGADVVILPEYAASTSAFQRNIAPDVAEWLVFDDRGMYRPGEEARVKGWLRKQGTNKRGDVGMTPDVGKPVAWTVRDARGAEVTKGSATIDESGGFDFAFKVPNGANLGRAQVELKVEESALSNSTHRHVLSFEEFRRPEFEVTAQTTPGPHVVGGHAIATVSATYYAGGGLPNTDVTWTAQSTRTHFSPPNRADYVFGPETPVVWHRGMGVRGASDGSGTQTWSGKTGPRGAHRLRVDFDALTRPGPLSIDLSASVTDVNRQSWAAHTNLLVHPASIYVGLKRPRGFVRAGDPVAVDAIVADLDGRLVEKRTISLRAARLEWEQDGEEWAETEKDPATCEVESRSAAVRCDLKTREPGSYRISATTTDEAGRTTLTEMRVWVMGDKMPNRDLARGAVELVADKEEYAPGDTAEILVVAPFAPAEGVVTVTRQGIVKLERFSMKTNAQTIGVKIDGAWLPGVGVDVRLVGAEARTDDAGEPMPNLPKRPAFAAGTTRLKVPPKERALTLTVTPREKDIEPGGATTVDIEAKDAAGKPAVGTRLAVVVVDEAVLALSSYKTPDPLGAFYTQRPDDARELGVRDRVLLAATEEVLASNNAPGALHGYSGGGAPAPSVMARAPAPMDAMAEKASATMQPLAKAGAATPTTPIAMRTDFSALALFAPKILTDATGHAQVPVRVSDSLTRYRVMAVAVQGDDRFGSAESTLTARLPLMVRPSPPRFLNFGDRFEMPIVVQNQTDRPMDVDVAMRAANATVEGTGRRVSVAANDRVEVRIPAAAANAGKARLQIGAASGRFADASEIELAVWTPATTEAFATYGTIDEGAVAQQVKMPSNVVPQFGGLEVTTSSTALQALTDAVLYLVQYPFECNEQLASRVVSIAALRDVLGAFDAKGLPPPDELVASVKRDTDRLKARQDASGGWGFWPGAEAHPYVTVHVTHALVRAKAKGFAVSDVVLSRALDYLRAIESHIPPYWSDDARRSLVAYALDVRTRMNDADRARAKRLVGEAGGADKLPLEANGWLLGVLSGDPASSNEVSQIRKHLANRVTETAGAAHFVQSYKDADYLILNSDRRADGVILDALIGDQPKSDLIPKIVTGLLAHRKAGHWTNTQENAFVLLALDRYFETFEKATPDFVARAWLGDKYAGEHAFKGRTTERDEVNIPMRELAEFTGGADLVLQKSGPGRLYYRIGMQYAPSDLRPPAMDRGFTVSRAYEGADKADDVRQDPDGTWRVRAGARVRVRLGMVAPARRYHVALADPLPAGFEPMNPALAVTGTIPQDPKAPPSPYAWWRSAWYEHQNMRDERVEAFASLLWEGVYEYAYVARATTPGTFIVAPPKAEEMYAPETFGRGAGDKVIVE